MGTVRTRFAPSPTGRLHIGNARTALFNWLFARGHGGSFILRIEDTDTLRSSPEHERSICSDLEWLGIEWDEGPDRGGGFGPYRQSERTALHRAAAGRLLSEGKAYRCYCTREQLEDLKAAQASSGLPSRYDGRCRYLSPAGMPEGAPFAVRFRVPEKDVVITDGVHGTVAFDTRTIGDFIIMGSDGVAAYNFAAAVDDAMMEITDVIRGDDHLSNTPRQVLVFEALGLAHPSYAHIPLVVGRDKAPLSKRHGACSVDEMRRAGFLPEAVVNAVARLGWMPGEGLMTVEELSRAFSIERLSASPSEFDIERLKAFNREAIQKSTAQRLIGLASIPPGPSPDEAAGVVDAVKGNATVVADIRTLTLPFLGDTEPGPEAAAALSEAGARAVIRAFREAIEAMPDVGQGSYKALIDAVKEKTGEKGKRLFMPLRLALTGSHEGIELARTLELLGRERALKRLRKFE